MTNARPWMAGPGVQGTTAVTPRTAKQEKEKLSSLLLQQEHRLEPVALGRDRHDLHVVAPVALEVLAPVEHLRLAGAAFARDAVDREEVVLRLAEVLELRM